MLPHINHSIAVSSLGRPHDNRGTGKTTFNFHAVYKTSLLPFQTDAPRDVKIWFFVTDGVGRANLVPHVVRIPAMPAEEVGRPLPTAAILNMEMFQQTLPQRARVRLQGADRVRQVILWIGDRQAGNVRLTGSETEVEIRSGMLQEYLPVVSPRVRVRL